MTLQYTDPDHLVRELVERLGPQIVMCIPLGLGKPLTFVNALYRYVSARPEMHLTLLTGLTLSRPTLKQDLEKRFVTPILERLLGNFEDPLYEKARELDALPSNIRVIEFFFQPGKYLHLDKVQQDYISTNYSAVIKDLSHYKINLLAVEVSESETNPEMFSLSSNSDLFHAADELLLGARQAGRKVEVLAEINQNLPFMLGDAIVSKNDFTVVLDTQQYPALFALPHDAIHAADHMIGLYSSALIPDGGSLQVGIGKLGNALANSLILRQENNVLYRELLKKFEVNEKFESCVENIGDDQTFEVGLYAPTEMLSDEYMLLYQHHILKRRVYDHLGLQTLLNQGEINETISVSTLDMLLLHHLISQELSLSDFQFLQNFGVFKSSLSWRDGKILFPDGETCLANILDPLARPKIIHDALGDVLQTGKIIHAGFFLGTNDLYQWLRLLNPDELASIDMTQISRTNSLSWHSELLRAQRKAGRFVNSCMMISLGGASVSDGLKDLREVSGVGGQFDFVHMAQQLQDGRSIIQCHSTRMGKKGLESNIVWEYPNMTAPRFFRDIFVTEYGIADCRSKTDSEVIKALLNIADSRFQGGLLKQAKSAGKIEKDYQIPRAYQDNYPEQYQSILKSPKNQGYFKLYPFGSEMNEEELRILPILEKWSHMKKWILLIHIIFSLFYLKKDPQKEKYLKRMNLDKPRRFSEWIYRKLFLYDLK